VMYIFYLENYPFTTGATSTGVVEVASKSTRYETMSNLHNMIKKQYIHKIEKYYITYCHILNVFILILILMQDVNDEL
jgi:hypothetical protein